VVDPDVASLVDDGDGVARPTVVRGRLQDAAAELGKVLGDYLISRML
jgi:hypothetical protein